jgi:SAM-dependent methyltransferase
LEDRFRRVRDDGVYFAHQPIYGFRAGHCEPWLFERYARTLASMRALATLDFASLVDVGAAEGYKAALARRLFSCTAVASDLSVEACERAEAIYGLATTPGDVQDLPFDDGEFDVALCSETLEHVPDFRAGVRELLRVSRSGVVITVPHEPADVVEHNKAEGVPHGHIQSLDVHSLDWLADEADVDVAVERLISPLPLALAAFVEGAPKSVGAHRGQAANAALRLYNRVGPYSARLLGAASERGLLRADRHACRLARRHRALQFVVVKGGTTRLTTPRRKVTPRDVMEFTVPLHRPQLDGS